MKLNAAQQQAVAHPHDAPLTVIAGAGTGKTQLLTERFIRLATDVGLAPERILCLTFTRKGAANMRQRILARLRTAGQAVVRPDALWITTFHSAAWRMLHDDLLGAGFAPDTSVMTELERAALEDRVWLATGAEETRATAPTVGVLWEQPAALQRAVFTTLGSLAMQGVMGADIPAFLAGLRGPAYDAFEAAIKERLDNQARFEGRADTQRALDAIAEHAAAEAATADLLGAVSERYAAACAAAHRLDYTDILLRATALCERDGRWPGRFDAVLVDECQDTNGAQFRFLRAIAADGYANVSVVGDRKQSIFSFQGARPDNAHVVGGTEVALTENYRSVAPILNVANEAVRAVAPDDPPLRAAAPDGVPVRPAAAGPRVWFTRLLRERDEAAWIAEEADALVAAGVHPGSVMIVVRSRARFPAIARALRGADVPYYISDRRAAWENEVLKTAVAILRVAVDPLDDVAMVRLLQEEPVALPDGELFAIVGGRPYEHSVYQAMAASSDERVRARADMVANLAARAETMPGAEFVSHAMRAWGLLDHVLAHDDAARSQFAALAQLYGAAARTFAAVPTPGMREFVTAVRDGRIGNLAEHTADQDADLHAVRISNIHQVKGLEFPIVFVAGLGPSRLPNTQTLANVFGFDEHLGFAQRRTWQGADVGRWKVALEDEWRARTLAEEQRLLYVAMTRAQERLYLTTSTRYPQQHRLDEPKFFIERLEQWIETATDDAVRLRLDEHPPPPTEEERAAINPPARPPDGDASVDQAAAAATAQERITWSPPAPPAPPTITLSFTQVSAFLDCPRLYAFRYRDRIPERWGAPADADEAPEAARDGLDPRVLGNLVHRALEVYHSEGGSSSGGGVDHALAVALCDTAGSNAAYRDRAYTMLQRYAGWAVSRATVERCEAPFVLLLPAADGGPAVRLRGAIDRIDRTPDGIAVWDYKSGDPAYAATGYAMQLRLYALAAEQALALGPVVRAGIIALAAEVEAAACVPIDVAPALRQEAAATVREVATRIGAGDLSVNPECDTRRPCASCAYRGICPDARNTVPAD